MDVLGLVSVGNLDLIRERIAGATAGELNAADKGRSSGWYTPLHLAVMGNRVDILSVLLDAGATIDPKNRVGYTPLLVAVMKGYQDCAEELVRCGADLSACNKMERRHCILRSRGSILNGFSYREGTSIASRYYCRRRA